MSQKGTIANRHLPQVTRVAADRRGIIQRGKTNLTYILERVDPIETVTGCRKYRLKISRTELAETALEMGTKKRVLLRKWHGFLCFLCLQTASGEGKARPACEVRRVAPNGARKKQRWNPPGSAFSSLFVFLFLLIFSFFGVLIYGVQLREHDFSYCKLYLFARPRSWQV